MSDKLFKYECSLTIRCHANLVTLRSNHNCGVGIYLFAQKNKENEIEMTFKGNDIKGEVLMKNFTLFHARGIIA